MMDDDTESISTKNQISCWNYHRRGTVKPNTILSKLIPMQDYSNLIKQQWIRDAKIYTSIQHSRVVTCRAF